MELTLQQITYNRWVHSPPNLGAFIMWAQHCTAEDLATAMRKVSIVRHQIPSDDYDGRIPMAPVAIFRNDLSREWTMAFKECRDTECLKCRLKQGGWHFRWVGPWTCSTMIGDPSTPVSVLRERQAQCGCIWHEMSDEFEA